MTTFATPAATKRYIDRFVSRAADGHFREAHGLAVSSLGMGTYLGNPDPKTDASYTAAVITAAESGINLFDAAINYRFQRSERSIGQALKQLAAKGFSREEFVVCTKGGYLTPDGSMPSDPNEYPSRYSLLKSKLARHVLSRKTPAATPLRNVMK